MLKTKEFHIDLSQEKEVVLTIAEATSATAARRIAQILRVNRKYGDDPNEDQQTEQVLATRLATLEAGTQMVAGLPWPISIKDFGELPDPFVTLWEQAVYELNPQWNPAASLSKEALEKNARSSSAG